MGESIDPIEYDVTELRELARLRGDHYVVDGFLWSELPDSFPPGEWSTESDRPVAWTGSLEDRQKPYLRRLPDDRTARRIAHEWVERLVERTGSDAVVELLAYYESLGWLTETVREELEGYLLAVDYRPGGSLEDLSRGDHVESLARTARLAQLAASDVGPRTASEPKEDSATREASESRAVSEEHVDEDGEGDEGGDRDGDWLWGTSSGGDRAAPAGRECRETAMPTTVDEASEPPSEPPSEELVTDTSLEDSDTISGFEFDTVTE